MDDADADDDDDQDEDASENLTEHDNAENARAGAGDEYIWQRV